MASSFMMAFRTYMMITLHTRSANTTTNVLRRWGWQILQRLRYHPDLSPYAFHLITKPKRILHGKRFANFNQHFGARWHRLKHQVMSMAFAAGDSDPLGLL